VIGSGRKSEAELGTERHSMIKRGVSDEGKVICANVTTSRVYKRTESGEMTGTRSSAKSGEFNETQKPKLRVVVNKRTEGFSSAERDNGGCLEQSTKVPR
jgi:hypothetical protein